ncbi:hypothetical protein O181_106941 [Austropuccinia psidii MF-1]|uniref:Peptidase A2 domain-containing protein n=1 Tax=Austropuccinia psidii MF-1 TaxID=1389203 RepID=A0A9Q3JRW4_9BASI|nr:hypothetical protein [Austropuccinia psidii MF-1]
MPPYETGDWEQLELDMKGRWGTVSCERRYKLSSITELFTKIHPKGGIRNMTQYKKFIGEYESIINYLKRLEILKLYIEHDFEAKVLIQQKEFSQPKSEEKKARFEEESWEEVLKQMKDLTQKIQNPQPQEHQSKDTGKESVKEVLNQLKHLPEVVESPNKTQASNNQDQKATQNSQPFRPRYPLPPISSGYQPYVPAQMAPIQLMKNYYCLEKGYSTIRCNDLTEDLDKRIVLKCGGTYLFPNFQRVPTEGPKYEKELVSFAKEQENFTKKMMEQSNPSPNKQETTVIAESKGEKATAIAQIEEWGNWKPPQISPANENLQINIPGAYHEEDEAEEEIRVLLPTKYKKTQERKEVDNDDIEIISRNKNKEGLRQELQKMELKDKVKSTDNNPKLIIEHVMKKILEQKINLTLEEILSISPTFIDKLQNLTTQEKEVIKSVNTSKIQERLLSLKLWDYDTPRLHYACPLGFMELFIGREEYPTMELVDTGSKINIIPEEIAIKASLTSRKLNMNLRGIGGHTKSLVGLSEFTSITMITGEENEMHLFIEKGAVHTILRRPLLADNNVKLEFSHKQGEIISYSEKDGL